MGRSGVDVQEGWKVVSGELVVVLVTKVEMIWLLKHTSHSPVVPKRGASVANLT